MATIIFFGRGGGLIYVGIFFAYSIKSDVTLHNVIDETYNVLGGLESRKFGMGYFLRGGGKGYFLVQGFFRFCWKP